MEKDRNFRSGSEPDGFGGIKWGTDVTSFSNMVYVDNLTDCSEFKSYKREKDKNKLEIKEIGAMEVLESLSLYDKEKIGEKKNLEQCSFFESFIKNCVPSYDKEKDTWESVYYKVKEIRYIFYKNKFHRAQILIEGLSNFSYFRDIVVFGEFGEGNQLEKNKWEWNGNTTAMLLSYDKFSVIGTFIIRSKRIDEQIRIEEHQKKISE